MASINKDSKGWRILFVSHDGVRRTFRPGKVDKRQAEAIGRHIDGLIASTASGQPHSRQTSLWLAEIGDRLHAKLANVGLVEPRQTPEPVECDTDLIQFCDDFIKDGRTLDGRTASDSTKRKWKTARNHFKKHFPEGTTVQAVTPADAQRFRQYLESIVIKTTGEPMRENAKRKVIASSKVMFNKAVRLELIERSPFAHEASSSVSARDRDYFVTATDDGQTAGSCPGCSMAANHRSLATGGTAKDGDPQPDVGRHSGRTGTIPSQSDEKRLTWTAGKSATFRWLPFGNTSTKPGSRLWMMVNAAFQRMQRSSRGFRLPT